MKYSIVFLGAGPVAAASLKLLSKNFQIEKVITKPQKNNNSAPVIDYCVDAGIPYQIANNQSQLSKLFTEKQFDSPVGVVIDYGVIIPEPVFSTFEKGIVNSHFSLLPEWRGADPITYSILSGQKTTGVTLMRIVEALDEGPVIAQRHFEIPKGFTTPELTDSLIKVSNELLTEYLPKYLNEELKLQTQTQVSKESGINTSYSAKIKKSDGVINWNQPAVEIERKIRAFIGWPQSRFTINDLELIATKATVQDLTLSPGELEIQDKELYIGCSDKSLKILSVKPIGKAEMNTEAFLAGYRNKLA